MKYAAGLLLLLLQDSQPLIDPEGSWEYELSSVKQKLEKVKAAAGWTDASALKGKFWGTSPALKRLWVMKHADAPILLASANASAVDLYRVCRGACGKPGIQPYE